MFLFFSTPCFGAIPFPSTKVLRAITRTYLLLTCSCSTSVTERSLQPEKFLRVMDLNFVCAEPQAAVARKYTVRLVTQKHVILFSLDARELYQREKNRPVPSEQHLSERYNLWIDATAALASLQNPFYQDKDATRKRSFSQ